MNTRDLSNLFNRIFHLDEFRLFFAPGRINLIGEHTDYNGGHVFPCAINLGTYCLARKREDNMIRLYSANFPDTGIIEFHLDELDYEKIHTWANYPKGIVRYFIESGFIINKGVDVLYYGNIPNGAGLSSSASLELVTGVMLEKLFGLSINREEMAKIGQRVENEFIGVNSGIMDQYAVSLGKNGHGLLLDCDTLHYKYIPVNLNHYSVIIMNTNKRRELTDSKYNDRRKECEKAVEILQQHININHLGNVTPSQFEELQYSITNPVIRKRAQHVIEENERTLAAAKALSKGDLSQFGRYLNESHISLRDNFEVTGKELDTIVEAAWEQDGVLGARMTGAGFGGCAIAIVETEKVPKFIENVSLLYEKKIGYKASFYNVTIGDGAREIFESPNT